MPNRRDALCGACKAVAVTSAYWAKPQEPGSLLIMLVRGGDLDPNILRADAARYYSIYGVYGISVFAVRDVTVDELAQRVPLVRFDRLSLLNLRDVLVAGMWLEPTGRNPRHYTVSFDDLEDGVQRLVACPHHVMPNAYHDA